MVTVISPAKSLDFETPPPSPTYTQPIYLEESKQLVKKLARFSRKKLSELMDISPKLALLNAERYEDWHLPFNLENAKQAIFAFRGDVYLGLEAEKFNENQLEFAQKYLRILSGLHGVLRPLDLMQPYRLEMGTRLPVRRKKNLYEFWGRKITDELNQALHQSESDEPVLVNLASKEYFQSVQTQHLKARLLTINFKEWRNGKLKFVSFNAKRARGMVSRFIIENSLTNPEHIKAFDTDGYRFEKELSNKDEWMFVREG